MDAQRLAEVGAALGSESRAAIVCALLSGTAHTGIELARHLGLARSTVSEHLTVLLDAGIVEVESQGRHRYVRLAGPHVAHQLEQLLATFPAVAPPPRPAMPAELRAAAAGWAARFATPEVHDALLAALDDPAPEVAVAAITSLAHLRPPVGHDVIVVLEGRRLHADPQVVTAIDYALGVLGR